MEKMMQPGEQAYADARELWNQMGAQTDGPWPLWSFLDDDEKIRWAELEAETTAQVRAELEGDE